MNYILQGVFTGTGATAASQGLANYPAAGKTGTSNVENGYGTPYAAFAGYTTKLAGYVSVFNPVSPTVKDTMVDQSACYRTWTGYQHCYGEMFGADARVGLAHDLRPREPVRFRGLRPGAARQRAVVRGRRADGRAA